MGDLSASEAAKRLGVKNVTVRAWCVKGLFPNAYTEQNEFFHHPIWRIPESDLKNFEKPVQGRPKKRNEKE